MTALLLSILLAAPYKVQVTLNIVRPAYKIYESPHYFMVCGKGNVVVNKQIHLLKGQCYTVTKSTTLVIEPE